MASLDRCSPDRRTSAWAGGRDDRLAGRLGLAGRHDRRGMTGSEVLLVPQPAARRPGSPPPSRSHDPGARRTAEPEPQPSPWPNSPRPEQKPQPLPFPATRATVPSPQPWPVCRSRPVAVPQPAHPQPSPQQWNKPREAAETSVDRCLARPRPGSPSRSVRREPAAHSRGRPS